MAPYSLLTDAAVEVLADSALTILERTGVMCQNRDILYALARWGAQVDEGGETVRFPRGMVASFVEQVRHEVQEEHGSIFYAPSRPHLGTLVAQFYYDDQASERRPGTRNELITLIKLAEALHPQSGAGHALLLREHPPLLEPLEAALVLAEYAHKPGPAFAWDVRQADYLQEMGEIIGISGWSSLGAICFAHPLRFDRDVAARLVRMAQLGWPIGLTGMQVSGASTPVTVAGFVAAAAAEFVATWMAGRALNARVPLAGSIWAGAVDMRSGAVSYSAPDAMLRAFATHEFLWRWCGQRVRVGGGEYSSAQVPGLYTALEKAHKAMTIAAFTGEHPPIGDGLVDNGKTISPVQCLLDTEMAVGLESLAQPVAVTPETLALDDILAVGYGLTTNHLQTEHTLRHYRESLWCPSLLNKAGWDGLEGEEVVLRKARQRVEQLVASYSPPETDPDKLARMREVVARARKELLG
jgi:trimethylamine---corrinoid protein Co-methyltransferase